MDANLHYAATVLGGKTQGLANAASGHLKRISQGSKRNRGMMWVTNGMQSIMQQPTMPIPEGWRKGRVIKCQI